MGKFNELYNQILFVESPQYHDANFNKDMQTLEVNTKRAQKTIQDSKKIDTFKNNDVFVREYTGDPDRITYVFIKDDTINAEVEISQKRTNTFTLGVWQYNKPENKGFVRSVFLDFLPKYYNSIVSDMVANKFGKEFWKKLLQDCINKGYKVTVLEKQKELKYTPEMFEQYWKSNIVDDSTVMPGEKLFKITY